MKIKSLTSFALLTTIPAVTAQPTKQSFITNIEENLKKNCDSVNNQIKNALENKDNPLYHDFKQRIDAIKKSSLPEKCKTDSLIQDTLIGSAHEGLSCYLTDKLEKVKNGGVVLIEKAHLHPKLIDLLESDMLSDSYKIKSREEIFVVILAKNASKISEKVFDFYDKKLNNVNFAHILFAFGDKEVPNFHKALYSLKNKEKTDGIPTKILHTAILNDVDLSETEKKHLTNTIKDIKISDETLRDAIKKTVRSIKQDCVDEKTNIMTKGLSIPKSSLYEFQKWDNAPLKKWVADTIKKDEL